MRLNLWADQEVTRSLTKVDGDFGEKENRRVFWFAQPLRAGEEL
jgi:hypothetical protein